MKTVYLGAHQPTKQSHIFAFFVSTNWIYIMGVPSVSSTVFDAVVTAVVAGLPTTGSTPSPSNIDFSKKAKERRARLAADRATLALLTKKHNLHYQHVLPIPGVTRGMTVCYQVHKKNVVKFSIALCGPLDQFSKWQGSAEAAKKFDAGQFTDLHVPHEVGPYLAKYMGAFINATVNIVWER